MAAGSRPKPNLSEFHAETIIEPFRIRSVEPIRFTTIEVVLNPPQGRVNFA